MQEAERVRPVKEFLVPFCDQKGTRNELFAKDKYPSTRLFKENAVS
jgi:hypothetical protein